MNRPKLFKSLRIAWSVAWGVVAVLLCVLWVRSYWFLDTAHCPLRSPRMFIVTSLRGRVWVYAGNRVANQTGRFPKGWGKDSTPVNQLVTPKNPTAWPFWKYTSDQYGRHLAFPHYLPVIIACALAALAGVPPPTRFSLRTLLIAATLVAVALGLIVWVSR